MVGERDLTLTEISQKGYKLKCKIDLDAEWDIISSGLQVGGRDPSEVLIKSQNVNIFASNWQFKITARLVFPTLHNNPNNKLAEFVFKLESPDEKKARSTLKISTLCEGQLVVCSSETSRSPEMREIFRIGPNAFIISGPLKGTLDLYWNIWEIKEVEGHDSSPMEALVNDLGQLMSHQVGSDVKLLCKDNVIVNAHKAILAARSPVFSAMFQTDMKELKDSEVEIKDAQGQLMNPETVKSLVKWMYTGKVDLEDSGVSWLEMLKLANFYQLNQLNRECQDILGNGLNMENAVNILVEADMLGANSLKETVIEFINKNKTITQTEDFETRVSRKLFAQIYMKNEKKPEEIMTGLVNDPNYQLNPWSWPMATPTATTYTTTTQMASWPIRNPIAPPTRREMRGP